MVKYAATRTIPSGHRKIYIPEWDAECQRLSTAHENVSQVVEKQQTAEALINHLNENRKKR